MFSFSRWSSGTGQVTRQTFVALNSLVALCLAGATFVFQPSEAREGAVVWQLLSSGEWLLPLRHGSEIPSKPPLFHWLSALLYLTLSFGAPYSEFFLRLPSVLAAAGLLLVTADYAKKSGGESAAVIAVAILSSCYGFSRLALDGRVDMVFVLFTTWATLIAFSFAESRERNLLLRFSLITTAATLTKGPLGLLIPWSGLLLATGIIQRNLKKLLRPELILSLAIPACWYLLAWLQAGDLFITRQLVFENFIRFVGGEGIKERGGFLFYFPHFVGQGAPWSILFLLYLFFLARSPHFLPAESKRSVLLSLIVMGGIFFLLTLSAGKRRAYLLLLLPHLALILSLRLGATFDRLKNDGRLSILAQRFRYETLTWGSLVWFLGALPGFMLFFIGESEGKVLEAIIPGAFNLCRDLRLAWSNPVFPALYLALILGSLSLWLYGHRAKRLAMLGLGVVLFLHTNVTLYSQLWLATKSQSRSPYLFAKQVNAILPENARLYVPTDNLDESYDALLFYLRRNVLLQSSPPFPRGLYLLREGENRLGGGQDKIILESRGLRTNFALVKH